MKFFIHLKLFQCPTMYYKTTLKKHSNTPISPSYHPHCFRQKRLSISQFASGVALLFVFYHVCYLAIFMAGLVNGITLFILFYFVRLTLLSLLLIYLVYSCYVSLFQHRYKIVLLLLYCKHLLSFVDVVLKSLVKNKRCVRIVPI